MITQPHHGLEGRKSEEAITLLCDQETSQVVESLIEEFQKMGIKFILCKFGDQLPPGNNIIAAMDLESPFFEHISEARFGQFQDLLALQGRRKLLWLTSQSQMLCDDPRSAQIIGVSRTIRSESDASFGTLEIDRREVRFGSLVMQVFEKMVNQQDDGVLAPDMEYVVDRGVVKIGRYHPFSLEEEEGQESDLTAADCAMTLKITNPGSIQTLAWSKKIMSAEVGKDEVEIQIAAVGLNFKVSQRHLFIDKD